MASVGPITVVDIPIVETERLRKVYGSGDVSVTALHDVDITFGRGEFTAIMGPSGSGKSTLMHCTAGLDSISGGTVKVNGAVVSAMNAAQRTKFRRDHVGFIFQAFNLIPSLSAYENITLPADIAGRKLDKGRFDAVISALGIGNRLNHRPAELSGGQQQRVACARALVTAAAVVFADEPTGNLDSEATESVLSFIRYAVDELGQSVIMVTHEPTAASWADRVVFLRDGDVHAEMRNPTTDSVLDALRTFSTGGHHAPDLPPLTTPTPGASAPSEAHLVPRDLAFLPDLVAAGPAGSAGEKTFNVPGLGAVTVTGDVHVHVYDHQAMNGSAPAGVPANQGQPSPSLSTQNQPGVTQSATGQPGADQAGAPQADPAPAQAPDGAQAPGDGPAAATGQDTPQANQAPEAHQAPEAPEAPCAGASAAPHHEEGNSPQEQPGEGA